VSNHGPDCQVDAWTAETVVEWWNRCGRCNKWRVRAEYIEMYDQHGWWPECLNCAVKTLGDLATTATTQAGA